MRHPYSTGFLSVREVIDSWVLGHPGCVRTQIQYLLSKITGRNTTEYNLRWVFFFLTFLLLQKLFLIEKNLLLNLCTAS